MILRRSCRVVLPLIALTTAAVALHAQATSRSPASSSSSAKQAKKASTPADSGMDAGTVTNGFYRNKTLGLTCKIPPGWVLRTDEMNAREVKQEEVKQEEGKQDDEKKEEASAAPAQPPAASSASSKVLLAAFSRPPEARAEDVNASILIAAESAASYPGLKEAAQYFFPLTEVAKAQGFLLDEDPYDIALGTKTLVRGDFHKNVGSRVMRQSTLALLSHGYAVSITVIGGTDDEVEDLIDGMDFSVSGK